MFDAGFVEMLLIVLVALLVIGPERLPGLASKIGYWIGWARRFVVSTKAEMEKELHSMEMRALLDQPESELKELHSMLTDSKRSVEHSLQDVKESMELAVTEAESSVADVADEDTQLSSTGSDEKQEQSVVKRPS